MRVMHRVYEMQQLGFESVLVFIIPSRNIRLDALQGCGEIHRRLLIICWWVSQVCQCALELHRRVVVFDEPQRYVGDKRYGAEAGEGVTGIEVEVPCGATDWVSDGVWQRMESLDQMVLTLVCTVDNVAASCGLCIWCASCGCRLPWCHSQRLT